MAALATGQLKGGKKTMLKTKQIVQDEVGDEENSEEEGDSENEEIVPTANKNTSHQGASDNDKKMLFIKNLPGNCTIKHIKAMTPSVKRVRLRTTSALVEGKRLRIGFAYLEYTSEEAAEKNYKILENAVLKGKKITVDYVGSKSQFCSEKPQKKIDEKDIDPLKLYVRGFPSNATDKDLRKIFPEATELAIPQRKNRQPFGYAFVTFADAETTQKYLTNSKDLKLNGSEIQVLFAKKRRENNKSAKTWGRKKNGEPSAKKVKKVPEVADGGDNNDDEDNDDDVDE